MISELKRVDQLKNFVSGLTDEEIVFLLYRKHVPSYELPLLADLVSLETPPQTPHL